MRNRGVGKVANIRDSSRTVVIDVLLSLDFAAILCKYLFLFPLATSGFIDPDTASGAMEAKFKKNIDHHGPRSVSNIFQLSDHPMCSLHYL
jgi:hypothetical protein